MTLLHFDVACKSREGDVVLVTRIRVPSELANSVMLLICQLYIIIRFLPLLPETSDPENQIALCRGKGVRQPHLTQCKHFPQLQQHHPASRLAQYALPVDQLGTMMDTSRFHKKSIALSLW